MKKLLLFAAAAIIAVSASAHGFGVRKDANAKANNNITFSPQNAKTVKSIVEKNGYTFGKNPMSIKEQKINKIARGYEMLKAGKSTFKLAAHRVGTVQAEYNAKGTTRAGASESWTMSSVSLDGDKLGLKNVISGGKWDFLKDAAVEYTLSNNIITIAPQFVGENVYDGVTEYVYIFSYASQNGNIELTLGEDGSLTPIDEEQILYAAFTSNAFDPTFATYNGYYAWMTKINYLLPGQIKVPSPLYEPQAFILHTAYSIDGNYWPYAIIPAYTPITLKNYTTDEADAWSWSISTVIYDPDTDSNIISDPVATSTEKDFTFDAIGNTNYQPAKLIASLQGQSSEAFSTNTSQYAQWECGGLGQSYDWEAQGSATHSPVMSRVNPALAGITVYTNNMNASSSCGIHSFIFYQGKPNVPLYIEGVNLLVYNFQKADGVENINLTCKLQKVTRDETGHLSLGDVIAVSELDNENIETGELLTKFNWNNFVIEDEYGLTQDLDYLFLEDEFVVIIEGWDSGEFSGVPLYEDSHVGEQLATTHVIPTGETEYAGMAFWSIYNYPVIGYNGAVYGFLYTEDNTNVTISNEGGEATIDIKAMLRTKDNETGEYSYRLFIENVITDSETDSETGLPTWLQIGISNVNEAGTEFSLGLAADALPAGETGRQATIVFMQEGALLKVTVTQGEVSSINATKTTVKTGNAQMYNLAGQRVGKEYKGLVIKSGKKILNK